MVNTASQNYESIPAGHLRAEKNSDRIFQAFLGSCLGVALYDKQRNIGGMINILLPEPPDESRDNVPEKYASTGLPILIEKLKQLGSSPSSLSATMAGGGLVGKVSHQDLEFDIGGRSAEITLNILKDANIPVVKSETGGFCNCTLELDMTTGETKILSPWEDSLKMDRPIRKPSITDIMNTIETLKPIPQTALKILRMFQDSRFGVNEIAAELSKDQVLGAQTLKICNSVLFIGAAPIETIKEAVLIMGQGLLVQSVITAAIKSCFQQVQSFGYSLCKGGLYFQSVSTAMIAEQLAAETSIINPSLAYTAGLLHGIGKIILDQFVADCSPLFFRGLQQSDTDMISLERKVLGITHCEAGMFLAKKWHFSPALSQVIAHHPFPEKAHSHKDLVYLVYLADLLADRFYSGISIISMQTESLQNALDRLGLTMEDLPNILSRVPFELLTQENQVSL